MPQPDGRMACVADPSCNNHLLAPAYFLVNMEIKILVPGLYLNIQKLYIHIEVKTPIQKLYH